MNYKARIDEIYHDCDGWWVILNPPWTIDGCGGWREDTKAKLMQRIAEAVPDMRVHEPIRADERP